MIRRGRWRRFSRRPPILGREPGCDSVPLEAGDGYDVSLTQDGRLQVTTSLGSLYELAPLAYALKVGSDGGALGQRRPVNVAFQLEDGVVSYDVGLVAGDETLVIDPQIVWNILFGGTSSEYQAELARDASGIYVSGSTTSLQLPTTPGVVGPAPGAGGQDWFLLKLNTLNQVQYLTYLGGSSSNYNAGVMVLNGEPILFGSTFATGPTTVRFPGPGGGPVVPPFTLQASPSQLTFRPTLGTSSQYNCAMARLNSSGTFIQDSTAFSSSEAVVVPTQVSYCYLTNMTRAPDGTYYLVGATTYSQAGNDGWPSQNGLYSDNPQSTGSTTQTASVMRLSADWNTMLDFTYLSLPTTSGLNSVQVVGTNVYVAGFQSATTTLPNIFTNNIGVTTSGAGVDVTVSKLNQTLSGASYVTRIGGVSSDYVCGSTTSMISVATTTGTLGGDCLAVTAAGEAYVTGATLSADFAAPLPGAPFQATHAGNYDAYVIKLNAAGTALASGTFLGGSGYEYNGRSIALDPAGRVHVIGTTNSGGTTYPVPFPNREPDSGESEPAAEHVVLRRRLHHSVSHAQRAVAVQHLLRRRGLRLRHRRLAGRRFPDRHGVHCRHVVVPDHWLPTRRESDHRHAGLDL